MDRHIKEYERQIGSPKRLVYVAKGLWVLMESGLLSRIEEDTSNNHRSTLRAILYIHTYVKIQYQIWQFHGFEEEEAFIGKKEVRIKEVKMMIRPKVG